MRTNPIEAFGMDDNAQQISKARTCGIGSDQCLKGALSANIENAIERLLAPIAQVERLKRREYLTPEEVETVYGLKAVTLANKRSKAQGPEYIKDGEKILYRQQAIKAYLDAKTIRTRI
jgi:hypothetical protein